MKIVGYAFGSLWRALTPVSQFYYCYAAVEDSNIVCDMGFKAISHTRKKRELEPHIR